MQEAPIPSRAPATEMIGREPDLAVVIDLVAGGQRLVTITGRGGVGKTRLALEVLGAHRRLQRGTVAMVSLSVLTDADLVLPELASALGVPLPPGRSVGDALASGIADDDVLFVLDNFEHVTAAAAAIGELLERCPGLRVLATSQAPLHLRAERVVHLEPLPLPSPTDRPEDVDVNPSVRLYRERAGAVSRRFRYGADNREAVAELCRRLEGLPLAIELAAVRAGTLPASEILARLDSVPFDVLRQPQPDAPPRHHDLRAAIAWTYALLEPDEQRLLRRLAVTTGVFDIETAEVLDEQPAATTITHIATLADLRLIDLRDGTEPARYVMPWSIRAFAREQLDASGEATLVCRRHVVRAAERADALAAGLASAELDWSAAASDEEPAQLHALEAALELEMVPEALRIVVALGTLRQARSCSAAHLRLVDRALTLAAEHDDESPAHADARSLSVMLELPQMVAGDYGVQIERLVAAEQLARRLGNEDSLLLALSAIVFASTFTGDLPWARSAVAEALGQVDDRRPRWLARFRAWAGMFAHLDGDNDRAIAFGLDALSGAAREGDRATIVIATILLRPLVSHRADLDELVPSSADALALAHADGLILMEAQLGPLATVEATANGDVRTARQLCLGALVVARSFGDSPLVVAALLAAVETLVLDREYEAGAYLHGVVRERIPAFEVVMVPAHREALARSIAELRGRLGDDGFEAAATKGSQRTFAEGVVEGIEIMRSRTTNDSAADAPTAPAPELTPRQLETLRLVAGGLTNKEIAARLGITPKTVMHHLTIVFRILGVRTRTEAALWAAAHDIRA